MIPLHLLQTCYYSPFVRTLEDEMGGRTGAQRWKAIPREGQLEGRDKELQSM